MDLTLDNLQWLICHKTKLNQTLFNYSSPLSFLHLIIPSIFFFTKTLGKVMNPLIPSSGALSSFTAVLLLGRLWH